MGIFISVVAFIVGLIMTFAGGYYWATDGFVWGGVVCITGIIMVIISCAVWGADGTDAVWIPSLFD